MAASRSPRWFLALLCVCGVGASAQEPATPAPTTETLVFFRHGEKPANDEGQLTCRGLNRALALPQVLVGKFGRADHLFAPLTTQRDYHGTSYSYVRPLATIEPTAIFLGLPVDTRYAFDDIDRLQLELTSPPYRGSLVFLAWEHTQLQLLVQHLLASFGDGETVPPWDGQDFDQIFVVKIQTQGDRRSASFQIEHEQLNGLSGDYPKSAPAPVLAR